MTEVPAQVRHLLTVPAQLLLGPNVQNRHGYVPAQRLDVYLHLHAQTLYGHIPEVRFCGLCEHL